MTAITDAIRIPSAIGQGRSAAIAPRLTSP